MSAFITLLEAAEILAGQSASSDAVYSWLAILESQADELHAAKSWTTSRDFMPGGISYIRPPEEWRIPRIKFVAWRSESGYAETPTKSEYAGRAEPKQAAKTEEIKKRATLINEVKGFWPSIERDLRDASRNGLANAAKHSENTFWKLENSLNWAAERGKITKDKAASFVSTNPESTLSPLLRHLLKLN